MAQTLVNFRIDKEVKEGMEKICKDLGINMSTAFNIFAKKMIREKRIPFEVSVDPFYSESNIEALKESIKQLQNSLHLIDKHIKSSLSPSITIIF